MNTKDPSPQTTLVVLLAASEWPLLPGFQRSEAFANASKELSAYFLEPRQFVLPPDNLFDCCFAAAAFSAFQAEPAQVALEKTMDAFEVRHITKGFPSKGTTLLCSSGHKSPSMLLPDASSTMFSKGLLAALIGGSAHRED